MSTTNMQIGVMKEVDADYLEKIVAEAKDIVEDFGNYNTDDYTTEQLCVVAYENSLDVMYKYTNLIDPVEFDWTAMIIIMMNDDSDKLTLLSADEEHRLREAFPEQLGEALAYLSISRNVHNDFQPLSVDIFESDFSMPEIITVMANGSDVDSVIAYTHNVIYEDFYKFLDNK